jgi:hypothetical protein
MLTLLLVGLSTAFILALLQPLIDIAILLVSPVVINALSSITSSFLLGLCFDLSHKERIVYSLAGAFFGKASLTLVVSLSERHATVVNNVRQ